jgi:NADH-quinone oxidoreductase subunit G
MPHLIIDNRAISVAEGTLVIDAAEQLGIMIPRFCYLKALGNVGACRMCAVAFLEGPVTGVQMSCMIRARDGMVVSTTDQKAVDFRRQVIEWLMVNHPHDCPVCDEGGHCLLQEETISGGHGIRRYPGRKRTYRDQYLGPFIQHEMNRCIHCYRCSRFYQEYAGYRDFGPMQIASRMYFGRFADGPLENPFSGNLVDICPTGVLTDKTARYKARQWDLEHAPSLCLHCSLGCNITANGSYRALVSIEARENNAVNGAFICDRGRFGGFYANHPERPWRPRINGEEVDWPQALSTTAERVEGVMNAGGTGCVAVLGSARSSMETLSMLHLVSGRLGWRRPHTGIDPTLERKVSRAVTRGDQRIAITLAEIRKCDFILMVGADPINEAPMLALSMRQAARKGTPVVVIDTRPISLPFAFIHLAVPPGELEWCLAALIRQSVERASIESLDRVLGEHLDTLANGFTMDQTISDQLTGVAEQVKASRRPVLICGTGIVRESTPDLAADMALLLHTTQGSCGLFYLLPGANAYGAALLSGTADHSSLAGTLEAIEAGSIKALVAVENDPLREYPDRRRLEAALAKLDLLLVLDYLPSDLACQAHILLPTATLFETESHFINQEGRVQFAKPVHCGGKPLAQISGNSHPPRHYAQENAEFTPRPAAQLLLALADAISRDVGPTPHASFWHQIADEIPGLPGLHNLSYPADGLTLVPQAPAGATLPLAATGPQPTERQPGLLELVLTELTFGTEELSSYSMPIAPAEEEPKILIHGDDAANLRISEGDRVRVHLEHGVLELPARLSTTMARGIVILPRHHQVDWQQLADNRTIPLCRVEKA